MSNSGKPMSELGLEELTDRLRLSFDEDSGVNVNKPDFRELDLGSPVSTLRTRQSGPTATTTSSSSSSSGSVSGRTSGGPSPTLPRKTDSPKSHSGELSGCSIESSPSTIRNFKPGHSRSYSGVTVPLIHSGGGSVNSPSVNVLPTGNICPSGRILKTGMGSRSSKPDVLGSGTGNYGHGSIMRGGLASKPDGGSPPPPNLSRGLFIGNEQVKKMGMHSSNDPEELKIIGNENYKKGHFAEALGFYDKAIAISPGNAAYHFNRAAALMGLSHFPEALMEYEEAIRLDPGYVRAHHRLGSLLLSLGQVENARKHICFPGHQPDPMELQKLQAVEKHLNKCADARRVGDWRSSLREADAAIASGADMSPQLCACRAEALLKLNQLDDAVLALSNIPKESSNFSHSQLKIFGMLFEAYPFYVRSQIELAKGRSDNALRAIEKAGQIDPLNIEISVILNNMKLVGRARARGNDLFKSERYTEACSAYAEGLRHDPLNSVLYCNRAACWFKLGQWARSVDDCNVALRIQPNYIKALLRRAASNSKLERWAEAVKDYEVLRRELPDDNEVAESLFHAQVALKKSRGEDVYNMKFGGEVESVSDLEQFRAAISSPGVSVVHFKAASNLQCQQISPFLDTLCARYPSVNFLKVDVDESPAIVHAENIRIVPTFKIYKKGSRVKEMVGPSRELVESSVRHYSI